MPAPIVPVQKKRGWGCLGCGCAVVVVIVLLLLALAAITSAKVYHFTLDHTGTQPVAVPAVENKPAIDGTAQHKLNDFENAFEREQPATLRLNTEEINTLIESDPGYAQLHGRVFISLQGQTANLQASLPFGAFQNMALTHRYLNANATLGLSFDPATHGLRLDFQSVNLNGQTLPESNIASLNPYLNQMINQRLQSNQLARDFLARVKTADIENGELVIETK